ncbi:MAG: Tol-Pal system beta propeller repeat protein TolB [Desulfuromonas sp.]|nr:Tol-Pal system beta propeller repeat protein TolB [Desulfuromonas sp.]
MIRLKIATILPKAYLFGLLLSALFTLGSIANAKEIVINQPGRQSIPLAQVRVLPTAASDKHLADTIYNVLHSDLDLTGLFDFVSEQAFLDDATRITPNSVDVNFPQWRMLGAQLLLKGSYTLNGTQLELQLRLFDVVARRLLVGHNYRGQSYEVRRMVHSFADQILEVLTGTKGCFNTRIAFISDRSGNKELYLAESDGYDSKRITNHGDLVLNPDFSPLGRELIFTSYRQGNPDLYRKEIYTGREALISHYKGLNIAGRYRRDGKELALTLSRDGNAEIYFIGLNGNIHKRLTNSWGIDVDPSWNPVGDQVAFVSDRQGNPNIFIADTLSNQVRRLTYAGRYNATPAWSPDGQRIIFSRLEDGVFNLFSIRPDGSDERQLTYGAGNKEHPRWSPDGRFVVYSNSILGKKALYIMRADGSGQRRITDGSANCTHPAWSKTW